jgi:hypothetical protein
MKWRKTNTRASFKQKVFRVQEGFLTGILASICDRVTHQILHVHYQWTSNRPFRYRTRTLPI